MPNYALPEGFNDEDDYLKHISFEGAKALWHITQDVEDRLNHELHIIKTMGFAGYFLIVQDFIAAAREKCCSQVEAQLLVHLLLIGITNRPYKIFAFI